ncbi:glycosyltransferase family 2 protein [Cellulophaga sp. Hel_I_12]|uniref:glycosyltransferase family 2 protein n=1 Tax=Cellulophaga sp. Hel_I_12 TaxID=1249972 RepID=UPI0006469489|nr:glycosyltransferase family 2 protein [Cellulophaga sp. Hel_I_12]
MRNKLSVFIITFNEERIIEKCLKSLWWADEIVVVDSGSTDATLAICEKYGAQIFHKDFDGLGTQKQFALEQTKNNWVLSIDADEILTEALIEEIQELLKATPNADGYYIKRKQVFLDKVFNYGPESKQCFLRLFKKELGSFDGKKVNASIVLNGNKGKLKNNFLHFKTRSLDTYIEKLNSYATIYAEGEYLKNKKHPLLFIFIRVKYEFFKKYILELNFLNGKEGFYWAFLSTYYLGLKYIKTNEQYKTVKKQLLF